MKQPVNFREAKNIIEYAKKVHHFKTFCTDYKFGFHTIMKDNFDWDKARSTKWAKIGEAYLDKTPIAIELLPTNISTIAYLLSWNKDLQDKALKAGVISPRTTFSALRAFKDLYA